MFVGKATGNFMVFVSFRVLQGSSHPHQSPQRQRHQLRGKWFYLLFLKVRPFRFIRPDGHRFSVVLFFRNQIVRVFCGFKKKKELVTNSNLVDLGQGFSEAVGSAHIHWKGIKNSLKKKRGINGLDHVDRRWGMRERRRYFIMNKHKSLDCRILARFSVLF
jgi:hypothetical protein